MLSVNAKELGAIFIEFQIALVLSATSLASILSFHTALLTSEFENQQRHHVNETAENVLTIMQRELMRAGFVQRASATVPNLFLYSSNELFKTNSALSCITYRYDRNKNGLLDSEYFGFRLHNNAIQVSKGNTQDCTYISGWESITDAETITISNLKFVVEHSTQVDLGHTQAYIVINMEIASKLSSNLQLNFQRNVLTQAAL